MFRTLRCIVEYRSLAITGRSTRVWAAVEVDPTDETKEIGPEVALKDVWLDQNAFTEREIQNKIFSDIEEFGNGDMNASPHFEDFTPPMKMRIINTIRTRDYRKYFLTIDCDYQGITSKGVASSASPKRGLFFLEPASDSTTRRTCSLTPTRLLRQRPSHPTPSTHVYHPKRHYRLVYKELCSALHDLESLDKIFLILSDALIGTFGLIFMRPLVEIET